MCKGPGVLRGLAQESKDKARSLLPSEGEHGGGEEEVGRHRGHDLGAARGRACLGRIRGKGSQDWRPGIQPAVITSRHSELQTSAEQDRGGNISSSVLSPVLSSY